MGIKYVSYTKNVKHALKANLLKALESVGRTITAESKNICPVKTGALKRSISYKTVPSNNEVKIGSDLDYAPAVHNGSSKQRANPFIKKAVSMNTKKIQIIIKENLKNV